MLETLIDLGFTCSKNEIYDSIYIYIYTVRVYIYIINTHYTNQYCPFPKITKGRFDVGYLSCTISYYHAFYLLVGHSWGHASIDQVAPSTGQGAGMHKDHALQTCQGNLIPKKFMGSSPTGERGICFFHSQVFSS